jgi:hypothetical protein
MPDSIGTQHRVSHKSKLSKRQPFDDKRQKECGHVVTKLDRYTPSCNAIVSTLRHEKWHGYHTSTSPGLRDFHQ